MNSQSLVGKEIKTTLGNISILSSKFTIPNLLGSFTVVANILAPSIFFVGIRM